MSQVQLVNSRDIRSIAVLGAGTMGRGIAHVASLAGFVVKLRDLDRGIVDDGLARITANLDKGVSLGKISAAERDAAVLRIHPTTDLVAAVADADVVIEAAPEKLALKQALFAEVAAAARESAIFATNTSSLSVKAIARELTNPARVVGMHFFNPVHIMKLCEVIRSEASDPRAVETAMWLAERFGKSAILVNDAPGFASSRLGLVLGLEAIRMVEQGVASAADIDTALKLGYGHPMGPLELTDLVGLDVRLHIADYLVEALGDTFKAPELLRKKVAMGQLGKKSGQGFYTWADGKRL